MNLIFLRHGQTDWNRDNLLQGRSDVPLNENGISGAIAAARIISNHPVDAVFCSPLLRARQTAELVCPKMPATLDARLSEWNFGVLEGTSVADNDTYRQMWFPKAKRVPEAETFEAVVERVSDFYREISLQYSDSTVLVIAHGGISAALRVVLCGLPEHGSLYQYCLPNTTPMLFRAGETDPVMLKEGAL